MIIKTPIIPIKQTFAKVDAPHDLHLEAICIFAATGFFLDQDTYWKDEVVLPAASICELDADGVLQSVTPWFTWEPTPSSMSFDAALDAFSELFKTITAEQIGKKPVILPLSGGLDSRTQAIVLKALGADVHAYSYEFENGYPETKIAEQIAQQCDFPFSSFKIPSGYLWNQIDALADMNGCYSDFCSPRQLAVLEELKKMPGVFSLGHWGDVLFDDMGVSKNLTLDEQTDVVIQKIVKRGGLDFAQTLWDTWDLEGDFKAYFYTRVRDLLKKINIPEDANTQIRAFKSLYWAPRWTSINLAVFEAAHPISLPYYDDRMCAFISSLPEAFLAGRRLQIAYIKKHSPELAQLTWDFYHPLNLYTYTNYKKKSGFGYRALNSLRYRAKLAMGKTVIQRNWELQFLGDENDAALKGYLFSEDLETLVPKAVTETIYKQFKTGDSLLYAHRVGMLLVFSVWASNFNNSWIGSD
ncbi:asparagine synthase-related protein [Bizionia hallyeonensis]|uniref:asparagine synthase (glutamine-hydrolyzing) n=1 Tax=Bizionia hallyeonensis TaxID=1123757 RepID=A0ABW0C6F3_9FLAO